MADIELVKKSDMASYYSKTEVDSKVSDKVSTSTMNTELGKKANTGASYTKAESDGKYALTPAIPTKVSQLTNDSKFIAENASGSKIAYDNATSGLTAKNVQDAINELKTLIDALNKPTE